jgi:hypothetical protein
MHDFCVLKLIISRRIRSRIQKALSRESGAQGVLFNEKTEGRKSRDTVPLKVTASAGAASNVCGFEKVGAARVQ